MTILSALALVAPALALESVGYAPWWTLDVGSPAYANFKLQAARLDEMVYFGEFRLRTDGGLYFADGNTAVVPIVVDDGAGGWKLNADPNYAWYLDRMTTVVSDLKTAAPDTRVTFTIGGWLNSENFAAVGNSAAASAKAASQIRALVDLVGFGGVDFDWEQGDGVAPNVDATAYANLTAATRAQLGAESRVSVAIQPNLQNVGLAIQGSVDAIRVMTYDDPGSAGDPNHTSVAGAETTLQSWMDAGVAANKLGIAVAMYGRPLADPWSQQKPYAQLDAAHFAANGAWLPAAATTDAGFGFDGPDSIAEKGAWARALGLGQIFAWDLSQDTTDARHYLPLTNALQASTVPEPGAVALMILGGLVATYGLRRRR